jgi:hypothetical protein
METDELRDALRELDLTQGALARIFTYLGDPADPMTIRRRVERWAQGGTRISGEGAALVNLLKRYPAIAAELRQAVWVESSKFQKRPAPDDADQDGDQPDAA